MSSAAPAPPAASMDVRIDASVPVLVIPATMRFEELRTWVREALPLRLEIIGGRACRLDLGEREITLFDLRRLIHLLRDEFSVDITGIYVTTAAVHRYAERELKLKIFPIDLPVEVEEAAPPPSEERAESVDAPSPLNAAEPQTVLPPPAPESRDTRGRRTLNLYRTIRSGAVVRFDGDVLLFGDVNPGAQVVAAGNVVILGALKGVAHAGATGDEQSFVVALSLQATQLRIGRKIATLPNQRSPGPEIARIGTDDTILVEPYTGRVAQLTERKETHHG